MTAELGLQVATSVLTVVTMWAAGSKFWWAWLIGLANQGLWLAVIVRAEVWGLLPLTVVLVGTYSRNLWLWARDQPAPAGPGEVLVELRIGDQVVSTTIAATSSTAVSDALMAALAPLPPDPAPPRPPSALPVPTAPVGGPWRPGAVVTVSAVAPSMADDLRAELAAGCIRPVSPAASLSLAQSMGLVPPTDPDPECDCVEGVAIDQRYGNVDIPDDAVAVQACNDCRLGKVQSDGEAAARLARMWDTTSGYTEYVPEPGEENDGTPGDWWVRAPRLPQLVRGVGIVGADDDGKARIT